MPAYRYELWKDGVMLMDDRASVISEFLEMDNKAFHKLFANRKLEAIIGEYVAKKTARQVNDYIPRVADVDYSSYECVLARLKQFGNTNVTVNPTEYIERMFKEELMEVRATVRYEEKMGKDGKYHPNKKKPNWLLEVTWTSRPLPTI